MGIQVRHQGRLQCWVLVQFGCVLLSLCRGTLRQRIKPRISLRPKGLPCIFFVRNEKPENNGSGHDGKFCAKP